GYDLFLNADLDLPYHMMAALAAHSDVPVPNLIAIEYDSDILGSPFLVMDAVSGRVVEQVPNYNLEGWVADLPPQERKKLWFSAIKAIANLHRVNWKDGFEFLDDPARGAPGLDQYLDWVKEWYLWARADRPQPVADIALD